MGSVIKANRYRLVDNHAFELPLPLGFEVWKEKCPVAEYKIGEDESVSCRILTKYKENMLTPLFRPLNINDIYYLLSCRVFQDRTPYTGYQLERLGLEKYSVYDILRKTHGITPYDQYWLRFEGESCTYESVFESFCKIMEPPEMPAYLAQAQVLAEFKTPQRAADSFIRQAAEQSAPLASAPAEPSGGVMAQDDIEKLIYTTIAPDPEPVSEQEPLSGSKMTQEEIEALLSSVGLGVGAPDPEPAPAESTGGMMSQDAIEAMFAAQAAQPEPAPAEPLGGKMSQDAIEAMFAAQNTQPEPAPAESSGGMMSQDAIEAMFAAQNTQPEPAPAESSGGMMSQDDIEALIAAQTAAAAAEVAAPAEPSGGKLSQDEIERMLADMKAEANK